MRQKKCIYKCMLNVYKNQQNRQTGSRNLMGPKTLPTIWGTYMKLVTKYQICAIFFVTFFSATIDGRDLIFGHKLHIGTPYRGKRFWTHHIPTSCLPTLLIFVHIEHTFCICLFLVAFFSATIDGRNLIFWPHRQTGSRNLMGPKTLPTIWGTYMKLVTKYQICAINSGWEKCDEKCAYMFNVYKNQLSRQTGSRNLTGPKTLPTIWYTYMTLVTKYKISAINSYWENCDKKYLGRTEGRTDGMTNGQTDRGKTVYHLPLRGDICTFFVTFFSATIDGRDLIFGHKLHIGTSYRGKRFWTHQIPTSCLPTMFISL
jgi:hypothetical protein